MNLTLSKVTPGWATALKATSYRCGICNRSLILRQMSARKAGIRMHNAWYCSSPCFTAAAQLECSELLRPGVERGNHISRIPLGLILISKGLLSPAQFKEVTEEQRECGGEIGELLVRRGTLTERQVTAVRATQWGCPMFSMPKDLARIKLRVPYTLMKLHSAVPLHYSTASKVLLVGFVHGVEYGLLYAIEVITGCKTQPCFVTPTDFEVQMKTLEAEAMRDCDAGNEHQIEGSHNPAELAEILCAHGVDLEADEVALQKCREYIWARFMSGARDVDLLLRVG